MMRGKSVVLLVVLLTGLVGMFLPTTANSETATGYGTDPFGNEWKVTSTAGGPCTIEDAKGKPYPGIEFKYVAESLDLGANETSVIQANVDYTVCDPMFIKTAPDNRQVKFRDCDPNAPFRCDDPTKDVVTFEVINQITDNGKTLYEFKFCANDASVKKATVQLKTPLGNIIVPGSANQGSALGPGCCTNVGRISEAVLELGNPEDWEFYPEGSQSEGSVVLSFDRCTGDMNAAPKDAVTEEEYTPIPGGYLCSGTMTSYNSRDCDLITLYGPAPLGALFINKNNIYVGYSTSAWKGPAVKTYPLDLPTNELICEAASAYSPTTLTYGDATIDMDWCGNLTAATSFLWFCEADSRMRLDSSKCGLFLTGSGTFTGTCCIFKNGRWQCYPDYYCK